MSSSFSLKLIPLSFTLLCLVGCGASSTNKVLSLSSTAPSSGGGGGGSTPTLNTSTFSISLSGFSTSAITALHQAGDWSKSCEVSPSSSRTSGAYIDCILEMDELDVYFTPYLLSLNSPAGMCDFTGFMPYWYYSQLPGVANDTFKTTTNPSGTTLNFDKDTTSGNPSTLVQVNTSGQPQCAYDYSPNGPNCCMGNYTWTKVNIDSTGNTTTNVINDKWPGKWGNCGAGAGYNVSPSGFSSALATPAEIIDNSTGGKLITYNFKSGIQIKAASNVHMANYIKPTTIKPGGLVGPGGVIKAPSQYYFIKCYDHAMEENAWIRLQIQEWNVGGEILKKALGNPDISGADPIPPVYPADNPPTYNDFADWDDYVTGGVQYPGN